MDWLNYHQLLNFWLVAREGTMQKASEMLHVTPASVSTQVKQLERSLGVKLFEKKGRGLALTDMGEEVSQYAEEIFSTGRELMEMVKTGPVGRPRQLRVGIRDAMPKLVAYNLLQPALAFDPSIRLICYQGEMPELVADLAIHKIDVILTDTALDPQYKVQAYSHRLGASEVVIVGAKSLAKKYRRNFPASIDGAPFLMPMATSVLRRGLDQWFDDLQLSPIVKGEFADSAMMKIAGRKGLGLFAIPSSIVDDVTAIYGLDKIGVVEGMKEQFFAVSTERKLKHPAVLAIVENAI